MQGIGEGFENRLSAALPAEVADKTKNLQPADRRNTVVAYSLLRCGLMDAGRYRGRMELAFSENGKPHIGGAEGFYFNVSHTAGAAACAVSGREVGVDVERHVELDGRLADWVCTAGERRILQASARRSRDFIRLWTLKESYIKYLGAPLSEELLGVEFSAVMHMDAFCHLGLVFKSAWMGEVCLSVCGHTGSFGIQAVSVEELERALAAQPA
jgi:4'-phosphopantetheinyl transferase